MIDFSQQFQNHSNIELLRIIENAKDYQVKAVEAANARAMAARSLMGLKFFSVMFNCCKKMILAYLWQSIT